MNAVVQPCSRYPAQRADSIGPAPRSPRPRRRFLCATDLSPRSVRATRRAAILARQAGADLMLVHVVDERHPQRLVRMMANRAASELRAQLDAMDLPRETILGIAVRIGRPLQIIRDAAREWEADLVVLAAPSRRSYERVLGTKAERVVRALDVPVLFVRREAHESYRKALIATDLSDAAVRMKRASTLLRVFEGAHTTILHAFAPPYDGIMSMAGMGQAQLTSYAKRWKARLSAELARQAAAAGVAPAHVSLVQESARPFAAIDRVVRQSGPELLAIGTSRYFMFKRILLGSVADEVLRKIDCDILVISPSAAARPQFRLRSARHEAARWAGSAAADPLAANAPARGQGLARLGPLGKPGGARPGRDSSAELPTMSS